MSGTTSWVPASSGTQNEWITAPPIEAGGWPSGGPVWHALGAGWPPWLGTGAPYPNPTAQSVRYTGLPVGMCSSFAVRIFWSG